MHERKKVLAIIGSLRNNSSNAKIVDYCSELLKNRLDFKIYDGLGKLPHFNPELDTETPPFEIKELRDLIASSDAVLICTPEYIFSLPGSLKNAFEWCVSTMLFAQKPVGLITASASGAKGKEELELIMQTLQATFTNETSILIQGVKGKFDQEGNIKNEETRHQLVAFSESFNALIRNPIVSN